MPEQPLIFIHLPKTAGTSLRKIVRKNYRSRELFFVYNRHPRFNSTEDLWNFGPEDFKKYKVIMGHFPFNKKLFPFEDRRFVTIIRDPVQRAISYYHHVMNRAQWRGNELSLADYMESSGDIQFQNHQVRLLAGMKRNPITEKHLERAIRNIEEQFLFVGTSEKFARSVEHLHDILGWRRKKIFYENVTPRERTENRFSEDILGRLREINEYDIRLHEWVSARLESMEEGVSKWSAGKTGPVGCFGKLWAWGGSGKNLKRGRLR